MLYNLLILGAASAVALERRQIRRYPRVKAKIPLYIELPDGNGISAYTSDFSFRGLSVTLKENTRADWDEILRDCRQVCAVFDRYGSVYSFKCEVKRTQGKFLGLSPCFEGLDDERDFVRCTFAAADRWIHDEDNLTRDSLFNGVHMLVSLGLNGYLKMLRNAPRAMRIIPRAVLGALLFVFSFIPSPVDTDKAVRPEENHEL